MVSDPGLVLQNLSLVLPAVSQFKCPAKTLTACIIFHSKYFMLCFLSKSLMLHKLWSLINSLLGSGRDGEVSESRIYYLCFISLSH